MIASIPCNSVTKAVRKTLHKVRSNTHLQAPILLGYLYNVSENIEGTEKASKRPEILPLPPKDEDACTDPKVAQYWKYLECV